ncbi:MurR/RpiR family transcriptional regulator [Ruminiclostridium cellobioparum]|jgi:RpiR family carbohydrate utilization transcriptional regulator|uniref:Transcriptional regulator n=1 Tax=Ruminiclostridium cellobioparum subsp. termitidis CT1112 TaxID=1195236 RepID=S0FR55_RUMCE|nr:MurR/RpiR family transcriptional regulator [Ruminiclostridium cellobioparum]EMS72831.1 transcriptional regulator [Ruminiclostridium cellobioparum subsp. termitidis CT1112]
MQDKQCLLKIRSLYSSFSKIEKKIADYIFLHEIEIIYMSITEFSENCEVSETSIVRFCRKINLKGYQEFKLVLARECVNPQENLHEKIHGDDNIEEIINKITVANIEAIKNTSKILSTAAMEKAINAILAADRIDIYGVGASAFTAGDAKYKFMRIGIKCESFSDPHLQNMSAVNLDSKSVAIGISFSGSTKDTVDSLALAKKAGAFTIAITNYEKSPITKYANAILLTSAEETPLRSGALTSKIAQLQVLDIFYTAVAIKRGDLAFDMLNKTAEAVLPKLY